MLSWDSGPPFPLLWICWYWFGDLRCYSGQILGKGAFDILWTFQQRFCQILLYILLHLIILQEFGIEARCLLRQWERLWLRSSDYRNHRIFSLRCIHNELVPVSIKLKSTLDTSKARQIIRKAEKDLLQAQVKAINNILDQVNREIQECKAKLASIISVERLEQCQGFINKVS